MCDHLLGYIPGIAAIHILRLCSDEMLEDAFKSALKHAHFNPFERKIAPLLKAITLCHSWTQEEKEKFLDRLFGKMPEERANELFFYLLSKKNNIKFLEFASPALRARLTALQNSSDADGQKFLAKAAEKGFELRLPYDQSQPNRRRCFLQWFARSDLSHEYAGCIAANFEKKEWEWLTKEIGASEFADRVLNWLLIASLRPCTERSKYSMSSLFSHSSSLVEKQFLFLRDEPRVIGLVRNLTPSILYHCISSFESKFRGIIVRKMAGLEPQKVVEWLQTIVKLGIKDYSTNRIEELFELLSKEKCLLPMLPRFFTKTVPYPVQLTTYASLDKSMRQIILSFILQNRESGLETLTDWLETLRTLKQLPPFVQNSISQDFYLLLNEIDPSLALELKDRVIKKGPDTHEMVEFCDTFLPVGVDLKDPISRQKHAIKKLKKHFLTSGLSSDNRREFVRDLQEDLYAGGSQTTLVRLLIDEFPPQIWPFLFLHFETAFCHGFYSAYYEEKSSGGIFNKVNKDAPPQMVKREPNNRSHEMFEKKCQEVEGNPLALGDVFLWAQMTDIENAGIRSESFPQNVVFRDAYQWIDMAAQSFAQMIDNPYLEFGHDDSQEGWAMQHLYQAACETNTIHSIIQKFMQIAPPDKVIAALDRFSQSAFYYNREGFERLIGECLSSVSFDRSTAIAGWLKAYYSRKPSNRGGGVNVEQLLWKEGFTKDDVERAAITRILIQEMQVQFLSLFAGSRFSTLPMIQSLHCTDPQFCNNLFCESISLLCKVSNRNLDKLVIFQNFSSTFKDAGVEVLHLLSKFLPNEIEIMRSWYGVEELGVLLKDGFFGPSIEWWLLQFINPERLYPTIFRTLESMFEKREKISFYSLGYFLKAVKKVGCLEEVTCQLEHHPELLERMKITLQLHLVSAISDGGSILFPFVERCLPNWREKLMELTQKEYEQEKKQVITYGRSGTYSEIICLFKVLNDLGKLNDWLADFRKNSTDEMRKGLDQICRKMEREASSL